MQTEEAPADSRQMAQLMIEKLARTVRSNARKDASLTPLHATSSLPGLSSGRRRTVVAEIAADGSYPDIRSITTPWGLEFLYSSSFISPGEAAEKASREERKFLIGEKVRKESRTTVKLISLATLQLFCSELLPDSLETLLEEMQTEPRYRDLKRVAHSGRVYFYSELHMTDKYAALLARYADKDPCCVIAEAVREESQVYPRPTDVQLFRSQVYGIALALLGTAIDEVVRSAEYPDIRKVVEPASGSVYLYSDRYLNENVALAAIRHERSGQR